MEADFSQEYRGYREQLHRYLISITHDRDVAEDVAQEAFSRLYREVSLSRSPREPRAWLYRVGRNLVIDRGRQQQTAIRMQDRLCSGGVAASAEEEYLNRESRTELGRVLSGMNAVDRTALLMAADGYSGAEIAGALGISEGAARTRMSRARGRMRKVLRPSVQC